MLMTKKPEYLRQQALIAGQWCDADSGETMPILNPADQSVIGHVPLMGAAETARAIDAAATAQKIWAAKSGRERATVMRRFNDLVLENKEDLAIIMVLEQGKPLQQARDEVAYAASYIEWYAEEAPRIAGHTFGQAHADKDIEIAKAPVGVTVAITPWNFPSACVTRKLAPALAAGCAQVIKPAPTTPFSALALAALSAEAGFPAGLISVVTGDAVAIGAEMTRNPIVRLLTFTGSTAIGKLLYCQCADTVKKVALELGGNAPLIVFDDADLDQAVAGLMGGKFRNMGQVCIAPNRVYVQDSVFDAFAAKLVEKINALTVGPGMENQDQGPLATEAGFKKVCRHVDEAIDAGAKVLTGGKPHALGGWFYAPTILTDVPCNVQMACDETFGPVVPLHRFVTEEEVILKANNTPYGLASYLFTQNEARLRRVSAQLETGIIGANTGLIGSPAGPFGGIKESGIGREGSLIGLEEFLEAKYICRPCV